MDLRRYCDDTFYTNNCFPPYHSPPCPADFHFVLTSPMAHDFARLSEYLDGRAVQLLGPFNRKDRNASNSELLEFVVRHIAAKWAPDHVIVQRHEEVRRKVTWYRDAYMQMRTNFTALQYPSSVQVVKPVVR